MRNLVRVLVVLLALIPLTNLKDRDTVEAELGDFVCEAEPVHEFTSDGCSMFPDGNWVECCVEHDKAYWCGGSFSDREQADRELGHCVAEKQNDALGFLMYMGVRAGGVSIAPTPFRWGHGWPYARSGP